MLDQSSTPHYSMISEPDQKKTLDPCHTLAEGIHFLRLLASDGKRGADRHIVFSLVSTALIANPGKDQYSLCALSVLSAAVTTNEGTSGYNMACC